MFGFGVLADLATSLISGGENNIEKLILEKLEHMGEEFLKEIANEMIPGVDLIGRGKSALQSRGMSEVNRLRSHWLSGTASGSSFMNSGKTAGMGGLQRLSVNVIGAEQTDLAKKIQNAFFGGRDLQRTPGLLDNTEHGGKTWQGSRQQWLDAGWRHDWRSQPRDKHGRWLPGRLKHPYMTQGARRIRRQRRTAARKAAKQAYSEN